MPTPHRTASSTFLRLLVALLALLLASAPAAWAKKNKEKADEAVAEDAKPPVDPALFQALEWRLIGPFRGGRSTAVAGIPGDPLTYYFGGTGGGVWKTTDAGTTWKNVSDGFLETGSVGALAVAPSDANVVYVGMGESEVRGVTSSHGDGVYRSTDAGKTWTHLGLEATRQISEIRVHPSDPDTVWIAAQGSPWGPTEERGIYKSTDGGVNWERVHFVDENSGAADLALDPTNPRILYAAFWDHQRKPWQVRSGGPGSGIWKSVDGGASWEKLEEGLPAEMGKVGVAVSGADPERLWAIVEAEEGGLFRSDDAGKTWTLINPSRTLRARAWYYTKVFADPGDADTVYVLNAPMLRSIDGGKSFTSIKVPHGDTHDLWIAPENSKRMINANDGGANISWNGGKSWSTQDNQPTAQFYRVATDNQYPYRVYGGQQDNSSVSIASRAPGFGIGREAWFDVAGCESAYLAFDPDAPRYVYGGCYQGLVDELDVETRAGRQVMAYPSLAFGADPKDLKYRFNWNAPLLTSPHDRGVIYHAANVLLRSDDRGHSWREISPDLTRDEEDKQGPTGVPFTNETAGGEVYNTIFYVVESEHEAGTIWVGSDDGLVHLTRDGGETWSNVTPAGLPESQINAIEVSPHDPASAWIAVTRYKFGDFTPWIYKTEDYGASWTQRTEGIDENAWVRVVREDPDRRGLLYAGTETGLYISFDDGRAWQPFQLELPVVPITDLTLRNQDLVAATQGRAFWILDDLTPLHQIGEKLPAEGFALLEPRDVPLDFFFGGGGDSGVGKNPPSGVAWHYVISEDLAETLDPAASPDDGEADEKGEEDDKSDDEKSDDEKSDDDKPALKLEILDSSGEVVRTFPPKDDADDADDADAKPLPAKAGLNRLAWAFDRDPISKVEDLFSGFGADSYTVAPGTYTARLSYGETVAEQSVEVLPHPRLAHHPEAYAEQQALLAEIRSTADQIHDAVNRLGDAAEQIRGWIDRTEKHAAGEEIAEAGEELLDAIEAWKKTVVETRHEGFQDIINFPNPLAMQVGFILSMVGDSLPPVTEGSKARYADLLAEWEERRGEMERLLAEDLAAFNALVAAKQIPAVILAEEEGGE